MSSNKSSQPTVQCHLQRRQQRRLPRWHELKPLLGTKPLEPDPVMRRLAAAKTIPDLAAIARKRTPKPVFDYVAGAAESEISLRRARRAFASVEFEPRVLRDVSNVNSQTSILGHDANMPLILGPTGFTRMMHHEGEAAVARAAAVAGVPYALSIMGTTTPKQLEAAAPHGNNWFQLYLWNDRAASKHLIDQALAAGLHTLILTVDTPVSGNRLRDARNGMTIPPTLSAKTLFDMAKHPAWWGNLLTTEPLEFAMLNSFDGTVGELVNRIFDPALNIADLEWLRSQWPGPLVVKGIQSVHDAHLVANAGCDAIVVSNHGGRQLDRAPTPLEILPDIAAAVGERCEIYVDTGIESGADLVAAVGLGATAGLIGRAYLYGLMAGGERGVTRALDILQAEVTRTLQLMGATDLADVQGRVRLRGRR